jgi:hypothetical protein
MINDDYIDRGLFYLIGWFIFGWPVMAFIGALVADRCAYGKARLVGTPKVRKGTRQTIKEGPTKRWGPSFVSRLGPPIAKS